MKRALLAIAAVLTAIYFLPEDAGKAYVRIEGDKETFRLIHAIGNKENELARGMRKQDCELRRDDTRIVAAATGAGGSVTCLPESLFDD